MRKRYTGIPEVEAEIVGPLSSFGEVLTTHLEPRVQIDAVYGIRASDVQTYTSGTGSAASASGSLFTVTSGSDVGGYGTIRSLRTARYRPGVGLLARFTAMFDAGVALYLSGAGMFSATDGYWFGYSGTTFGVMRRIAGAAEIRTLTITGGATGNGTIAVQLDGTSTNVSIGGALSAAATAQTIAATAFSGWTVTATGAVVTFLSQAVSARSGAYSFSAGATGATATGPTQVQVGAANDNVTGFVPQTNWNIDRMDGSEYPNNPSRMTLDPSKLNVYQIQLPYLGAGGAVFSVMSPETGRFHSVHRIQYPNANTVPNADNPTMRVGWLSASLGATTSRSVTGASAALFLEGPVSRVRNPYASARTATSVSSEVAVLSIRNRPTFASVTNQREIRLQEMTLGVEGTRPAVIKAYINPTLSGTPAWTSVGSESCVDQEQSNGLTITGGTLVTAEASAGSDSAHVDLSMLDIRLAPGDIFTITAQISGGAGNNVSVGCTWEEV